MIRAVLLLGGLAVALAGCQQGRVEGPGDLALKGELVRLKDDGPPKAKEGECWASSVTPAVIETVTEQVLLTEEVRDESGAVIEPATYQTHTQQRMVQEREEVWFRAPCDADMTAQFVASVQRALKARGIYQEAVSGVYDAATAEAVRRFQEPKGLDSPVLSLAVARDLGLVNADLSAL